MFTPRHFYNEDGKFLKSRVVSPEQENQKSGFLPSYKGSSDLDFFTLPKIQWHKAKEAFVKKKIKKGKPAEK